MSNVQHQCPISKARKGTGASAGEMPSSSVARNGVARLAAPTEGSEDEDENVNEGRGTGKPSLRLCAPAGEMPLSSVARHGVARWAAHTVAALQEGIENEDENVNVNEGRGTGKPSLRLRASAGDMPSSSVARHGVARLAAPTEGSEDEDEKGQTGTDKPTLRAYAPLRETCLFSVAAPLCGALSRAYGLHTPPSWRAAGPGRRRKQDENMTRADTLGVFKRISNIIQNQYPLFKFEDEGGPGDRETMNWSD